MVHKRPDETRSRTPETDEPRCYRVDVMLNETGQYMPYTSRKGTLTEAMARSLGEGLKRQGSGGRIVTVDSRQTVVEVIDSWPTTKMSTGGYSKRRLS